MKLEPLSEINIDKTIELLERIFPNDVDLEINPRTTSRASLKPKEYKEYWEKQNIKSSENFVLKDKKTDKIIGATGLYTSPKDSEGVVWLGWFGIDAESRGKGLGQELLEWTVALAKKKGFKVIKLWTTSDPNEAVAQILYEKSGFKITKKQKKKDQKYTVMYRERKI